MSDDDARKAILARRARFIAAAVLSAGIGARCDKQQEPQPQPCLTVTMEQDAGPAPSVCLSPTASPPTSWPSEEAPDADHPPPRVCLSPPRPCLKPTPPKDGGPHL